MFFLFGFSLSFLKVQDFMKVFRFLRLPDCTFRVYCAALWSFFSSCGMSEERLLNFNLYLIWRRTRESKMKEFPTVVH